MRPTFASLFVGLLPLAVFPVHACMVCVADPMERVLVTELEKSEEVVLARPVPDSRDGRFQIVRVLKGESSITPGTEVVASLPLFSEDGGKMGPGIVLLTRRNVDSFWIIRAPASVLHQVLFFQKVLSIPPAPDEAGAAHAARRTKFFLRYLHHADPLLDRAAAAEIANAPYSALKAVKEGLSHDKIRGKVDEYQAGEDQRALYYTLLGICGNEDDRALINERVDSLWRSGGSKNLAAMLTAKLELEGESAVDEIETRYFRDRSRTLPEIEAAVLALRVHGDADDAISRDRVIAAYHTFFDDREPLIFYIAADLARWEDWDSKERLVEIAEARGDDLPEIRRQVEAYLKCYSNSPDGDP